MQATYLDLIMIDEIGEKIAASLVDFFQEEKNITMIENLKKAGVNMVNEKDSSSDKLAAATFLITGSLEHYSRNEIKNQIEKSGGRVVSAVSKNLNYLIVGKNPGSKLKKAREISSIKIISESELLEMMK